VVLPRLALLRFPLVVAVLVDRRFLYVFFALLESPTVQLVSTRRILIFLNLSIAGFSVLRVGSATPFGFRTSRSSFLAAGGASPHRISEGLFPKALP